MANRREFLQGSGLALLMPGAASAIAPALGGSLAREDIYKVVFDTRHASSVAYASRASAHGLPIHGMNGDITAFWYHELDAVWKTQPRAVAGMTEHGPLFCLEQLGFAHGMRVIYRAPHADTPELITWVIAPVARA